MLGWHNETLNIWTHGGPLLLLLALLLGGQVEAWRGARWAFACNVGSIALCFALSVAYHSFMAHHHHHDNWLRLDVSQRGGGGGAAGAGHWGGPAACWPEGAPCRGGAACGGGGGRRAAGCAVRCPGVCLCACADPPCAHAPLSRFYVFQMCGILLVLVGGGHMLVWW